MNSPQTPPLRLLVLGAGGMLGHIAFRWFAGLRGYHTLGTVRRQAIPAPIQRLQTATARLQPGFDALEATQLEQLVQDFRPDAVINCVGLVKQLEASRDPLQAIPVNALLPHRLAELCGRTGSRLVHLSTDCVFSGRRGLYREDDPPDPIDLYDCTKLIGEPVGPHVVTLRTSMIGPELISRHGLLSWFLSEPGPVRGYARAVFSGLPTVEVARVLAEHVLPNRELSGTYHLASDPIDKYALLKLVADEYSLPTPIERDENLVIDRSLDGSRFKAATGFAPAPWPELVRRMREFG